MIGASQPHIAATAGVSVSTLKRAEGTIQPPASKEAIDAIRAALEAAGVVFLAENGNGPGVALRKDVAAQAARDQRYG